MSFVEEEERGRESFLDHLRAMKIPRSNSHDYVDRNYTGVQAEG